MIIMVINSGTIVPVLYDNTVMMIMEVMFNPFTTEFPRLKLDAMA